MKTGALKTPKKKQISTIFKVSVKKDPYYFSLKPLSSQSASFDGFSNYNKN